MVAAAMLQPPKTIPKVHSLVTSLPPPYNTWRLRSTSFQKEQV